MNLCNPTVIKEIMAEAGIKFRHDLGQNFLIDRSVPENIADMCADSEDCIILEIGPGIGCLTYELAHRYKRVIAVEIDTGLLPVLDKTLAEFDNVSIINADIMKLDICKLLAEYENDKVCVCANLPYYITTPILMQLLECGYKFESITIMIQTEVANRLCAKAGSADYGAITAVLEYYGETEKLFTVPAGCFMPAPKVTSAVIRINLYNEPKYLPSDKKLFFGIIKAAFEQRRKTLVNAINAKYPSLSKAFIAEKLESMGLRADIRGEKLSCADFVQLSDALI